MVIESYRPPTSDTDLPMQGSPRDLSLVLACYNEEPIIEDSVRQIVETLDHTRFTYEIIFVDDFSQDRTCELIDRIIAAYPYHAMSRIFHERNTGRGGAVSDGLRIAQGEVVGFLDIDLEVHARYIPTCVLALRNGADVATAKRVYLFSVGSLDRYFMSKGYAWLMRHLLSVNLQDTETGFKFFRRRCILPVLDQSRAKGWFWDTEVMVRTLLRGQRIVEVPCLFVRRTDKPSSISPLSDTIDYFRKLWRFRRTLKELRRGA